MLVALLAGCGSDEGPQDAGPAVDCTADPFAMGCPCLPGASTTCYGGAEETTGVGECRRGRAECAGGRWGVCDGEVAPLPEVCDTLDNDCDGLADDGVRSPCGGCTPGCDGAVWGEEDDPFVPGAGDGVALGPLGELTLARETTLEATTVWIANSADGTVSKIDGLAAVEVARYRTGGLEPSRVAVDYAGDAWVANRELDGGVSSVVKIAGAIERCTDAAGDGVTTSTGPDDVLPFGSDECVLLHVPVGGAGEVARALAIDGDRGLDGASGGNAWVGLHDGEAIVALDGLGGGELVRVETPGFAPYAAAFDPWGTLWVASRDGYLARVDRRSDPPTVELLEIPYPCFLLYGLAVDDDGRVVLTGFSCDDAIVYEPWRDLFRQIDTPASPRGLSVLDGVAWIAHTGGQLSAAGVAPLALDQTFDLAADGARPLESIGVGADGRGQVWIASSQGGPSGRGVATRFDPVTSAVTAQVIVGRAPHTQGDLTGAELTGGFVTEGTATHVFEGCPLAGETEWARVHVEVLPGAAGSVEVAVRHAASPASLAAAPFALLGEVPPDVSPLALGVPNGGVIELRLVLRTAARDGAPLVRRVGVEWACPGPG